MMSLGMLGGRSKQTLPPFIPTSDAKLSHNMGFGADQVLLICVHNGVLMLGLWHFVALIYPN